MVATVLLLLAALVFAVLAGVYLTWLAGRHDRLAARADAGWAALDAQLVRRAAHARALALLRGDDAVAALAEHAMHAGELTREDAENTLGRGLRQAGYETRAAATPEQQNALRDLRTAAERVALARQFHNAAVRDLHSLRRQRLARLMHLGRGDDTAVARRFFEIDDTVVTSTAARTMDS